MSVVESVAQSVTDTVEEKGIMYVTGTALPAVIPSTWALKGIKGVSKLKGASKPSRVVSSKFPYSREFIQNKINAAKEKLGQVPWLYREVVSTGFSNHTVYGVKPLGEVKPQLFSVKGEGKGIDNANDIKGITKLTVDDIPTAKSGNFNKFFNSLTSSELDELWKDKKIRKKIERQLRAPGGLHEWHLVSRAPQFKYWNISAEKIKDLRTAISDVKFVNPNGVHGGLGSTKAHNELLAIIDTSNDYNTFVRRLNNWANYRLEGGTLSLPEGLRLK
ncbi:hypothetical protein [Lentibacillus populi]|nr:hypothetical protein [Lentibacillus populi]